MPQGRGGGGRIAGRLQVDRRGHGRAERSGGSGAYLAPGRLHQGLKGETMKIKGDKLSATATMKIKHDYMHMDFMEMN